MSPAPPGIPRSPLGRSPVPVERGRAIGVLSGLYAFAVGFAVAGVAVIARLNGSPLYAVGLAVGFVGLGAVAFFRNRGSVPLPEAPIWSPTMFDTFARPLNLPGRVLAVGFYVLLAVGVLGNIVVAAGRR